MTQRISACPRVRGWAPTRERRVFWVILEVVLALAIAVGIVWWTLPRKRRKDQDDGPKP